MRIGKKLLATCIVSVMLIFVAFMVIGEDEDREFTATLGTTFFMVPGNTVMLEDTDISITFVSSGHKYQLFTARVGEIQNKITFGPGVRAHRVGDFVFRDWASENDGVIMMFEKYIRDPQPLEAKTFSCRGVGGFTFDFPIFEDWDDKEISRRDGSTCILSLHWPRYTDWHTRPESNANILVVKLEDTSRAPCLQSQRNAQGVSYCKLSETEGGGETMQFELKDFSVTVHNPIPKDDTFPHEEFWEMVSATFGPFVPPVFVISPYSAEELMAELLTHDDPTGESRPELYRVFSDVRNPYADRVAVIFGPDGDKLECCNEPTGIFIVEKGELGSTYYMFRNTDSIRTLEAIEWEDEETLVYDSVMVNESGRSKKREERMSVLSSHLGDTILLKLHHSVMLADADLTITLDDISALTMRDGLHLFPVLLTANDGSKKESFDLIQSDSELGESKTEVIFGSYRIVLLLADGYGGSVNIRVEQLTE